ncbi:hypothetical protein SMICM17S_04997 [Streptomyces microflavus]
MWLLPVPVPRMSRVSPRLDNVRSTQSATTSESTDPGPPQPPAGLDLTPFAFSRRCWVALAPDSVYRLISDVSLIELWSPSGAVSYEPGTAR